jgi:hypothetical protein
VQCGGGIYAYLSTHTHTHTDLTNDPCATLAPVSDSACINPRLNTRFKGKDTTPRDSMASSYPLIQSDSMPDSDGRG